MKTIKRYMALFLVFALLVTGSILLMIECDIDDGEVRGRAAAKLRKKQEKIEKTLTSLGYDTEGKKLEF